MYKHCKRDNVNVNTENRLRFKRQILIQVRPV